MDHLSETVATYEQVADEYARRHGDRSVVEDLVTAFLDAVEGDRILDVGCGPGWETAAFQDRGYDVLGIDLTRAFCRRARERVGGRIARMDMRELGATADAFDGAWACASFLHLPRADAPGALSELHRVLASGGVLCLSVKRGEGTLEGDAYEADRRSFTLYRPDELAELLAEAGFDPIDIDGADDVDGTDWVAVLARA